jgi:hypothetical protein
MIVAGRRDGAPLAGYEGSEQDRRAFRAAFQRRLSMQKLRFAVVAGSVLLASAAQAQTRASTTSGALPTGTCQVWINGLPANRQPAPTDCATARATAPVNSRIIYGNGSTRAGTYGQRSTGTYGQRSTGTYDPRTTGTYDPRYDPRSSQYDPRLDPRNQNGTYDARAARKAEQERQKYERKQQKERDKAWKKANKGNGHDDGDDEGDGRYDRGNARNQTVGSATCIDANRDGICDARQVPGRYGRP